MSAKGQKRTLFTTPFHVRFTPRADISAPASMSASGNTKGRDCPIRRVHSGEQLGGRVRRRWITSSSEAQNHTASHQSNTVHAVLIHFRKCA